MAAPAAKAGRGSVSGAAHGVHIHLKLIDNLHHSRGVLDDFKDLFLLLFIWHKANQRDHPVTASKADWDHWFRADHGLNFLPQQRHQPPIIRSRKLVLTHDRC